MRSASPGPVQGAAIQAAVMTGACYIAAQMLSDIASLRIVTLFGLSMDAGTLVYPLTFTLRDLVHKAAGARTARILIGVAAAVNLVMAGLFWLVSRLPADMAVGPQSGFGAVLSPLWRIVGASIIAEVLSELADTEVYSRWTRRFPTGVQMWRVLASNSVAVPLDSMVFCWAAFGGAMPSAVVWSIVLSNVLMKMAVTVFSMPLISVVREDRRE